MPRDWISIFVPVSTERSNNFRYGSAAITNVRITPPRFKGDWETRLIIAFANYLTILALFHNPLTIIIVPLLHYHSYLYDFTIMTSRTRICWDRFNIFFLSNDALAL
jgi:hypothetical protein